jgi:hypothetical protein
MCDECPTLAEHDHPSLGAFVCLVFAAMVLFSWLMHDLFAANAARPGRGAPPAIVQPQEEMR